MYFQALRNLVLAPMNLQQGFDGGEGCHSARNSIWRMWGGLLRISYAYSLEDLKRALERLERFIKRLEGEQK